jgi:hypothetical protein
MLGEGFSLLLGRESTELFAFEIGGSALFNENFDQLHSNSKKDQIRLVLRATRNEWPALRTRQATKDRHSRVYRRPSACLPRPSRSSSLLVSPRYQTTPPAVSFARCTNIVETPFNTMSMKAVVGRGLREAGAALKHSSGLEVSKHVLCLSLGADCVDASAAVNVWHHNSILLQILNADIALCIREQYHASYRPRQCSSYGEPP